MSETALKLAKEGLIEPKDAVRLVQTHSTRLADIDTNLATRALVSGFPTIDKYEYLLANQGTLVIIAARPGNGKSALACQIGLQVAEHSRVLMFSLEMTKEVVSKRMLSVISEVPIKKLGYPQYAEQVKKAKEKLQSYQFDIIDEPDLSINDIKLRIYDEYRNSPIKLVIIDYFGLVRVDNNYRALSLAEVAKKLKKDVAEKFNIPVLLLAQMKRGFEDRYAKALFEYEKAKQYKNSEANEKLLDIRPAMEDLGESSGLEHNADVVMFLFRPYLLNPDISPSEFKIFVSKNRNGEVKDFDLVFSQELTKFIDKGDYL